MLNEKVFPTPQASTGSMENALDFLDGTTPVAPTAKEASSVFSEDVLDIPDIPF